MAKAQKAVVKEDTKAQDVKAPGIKKAPETPKGPTPSAKSKAATKAVAKAEVKLVTVKDLAGEFNLEDRRVRIIIREMGYRAPAVEGQIGFGPRSKYAWPSDSEELKNIRAGIQEYMTGEDEEGEESEEEESEEENA